MVNLLDDYNEYVKRDAKRRIWYEIFWTLWALGFGIYDFVLSYNHRADTVLSAVLAGIGLFMVACFIFNLYLVRFYWKRMKNGIR